MKKMFFYLTLIGFVALGCKVNTTSGEKRHRGKNGTEYIASFQLPELTEMVSSENGEDDIQVYTVKIGNDPAKSHLTASFPVTGYGFVNESEKSFTEELIAEFKSGFEENSGTEAVSGLDFNQHFEVKFKSNDFLVFLYTQNVSYGNNYDDRNSAAIFDLQAGKKLTPKELFKDATAFERFAADMKEIARKQLEERIQQNPHYADDKERTEVLAASEEGLEEGTRPTDKNFDALFFDEKGDWYVIFDKYQIASGAMGEFVIRIPSELVEKYASRPFLRIFEKEVPPVEASPNPIASPAAVSGIDCSKQPCVALTFDDGPSVYTSELLDALKKENVKATFFVLGKSASVQPNTLRRIAAEGHNIGNHSYDHKDFRKISEVEAKRQIDLTDEIIEKITGEKPRYFRFPYGAHTKENLSQVGRPVIMWNVDPLDWKYRDVDQVVRAMSKVSPRAIILAHDIHKTTVKAIPQVIKNLKAQGYQIVSLDDLFRNTELKSGVKYSSGK